MQRQSDVVIVTWLIKATARVTLVLPGPRGGREPASGNVMAKGVSSLQRKDLGS